MDIATVRFNENVVHRFIVFVAAILIVFISGSLLISNESLLSSITVRTLYISLIFLLLLTNRLENFVILKKQLLIITAIFAVFIVVNVFKIPKNVFHFFIRLSWFLCFFVLCNYNPKTKKLLSSYIYLIVLFLASSSFILFVIINILKINLPMSVIYVEPFNYYSFAGIYYLIPQAKVNFLNQTLYRAQSIFWEPGVFAVFLSYTLYYELFIKEKPNLLIAIFIYICILTTFSTTGIMVGIGILGCYFLLTKRVSKGIKYLSFSILAPLALVFLITVWNSKKYGDGEQLSGSYSLRMFDLVYGFSILKSNPLFGSGYNNDTIFKELFKKIYGYERGSSNGLITWIITTGIIGSVLILYPFFRKLRNSKTIIQDICFLTVFILLNMTEPLMLTPLVIYIVANEYSLIIQKKVSS